MDEDALINMVADHEGRMTKLEYDVKERRTDFENQVMLSFDKIFGRFKNLEEEMTHMNASMKIMKQDISELKQDVVEIKENLVRVNGRLGLES